MADQHNLIETFPFRDIDDIGDVGIERNAWAQQMRALAQPGERGGEHAMAIGGEQIGHTAPTPAAMPGSVNEHEWCAHGDAVARMAGRSHMRRIQAASWDRPSVRSPRPRLRPNSRGT